FPQHPQHLPEQSHLAQTINAAVSAPPGSNPAPFLGMNLLCNAQEAGTTVTVDNKGFTPPKIYLNCGHGFPVRIPYYVLGLLMVGTMYYQQRQMQRAAPPGASQQQQALTKVMPLISIFWGFIVPSGVILYWTTSNAVQIGQQHFLLRASRQAAAAGDGARRQDGGGPKGPTSTAKPTAPPQKSPNGGPKAKPKESAPARRGFFSGMLERAEEERARRQGAAGKAGIQRQAPSEDPTEVAAETEETKPQESKERESKPQGTPPAGRRPGGQQGARSRRKRRKR